MSKLALDLCQRLVIVPTARWTSKRQVGEPVPEAMRQVMVPVPKGARKVMVSFPKEASQVMVPFLKEARKVQEQSIKAMRIETRTVLKEPLMRLI